MINPIKKFKDVFKKEEVIELLTLKVNEDITLEEIFEIHKKIIGKTVTFKSHKGSKYGQREFKYKIDDVILELSGNRDFVYRFVVDVHIQIPIDVNVPLQIWGKRVISKEDPYGEEDWSE